jgi:hypothetical protein
MNKLIILLLTASTGCAHRPIKECNLERIANAHRVELSQMLSNYPCTTMELMRTIATLEQEAGGYQ